MRSSRTAVAIVFGASMGLVAGALTVQSARSADAAGLGQKLPPRLPASSGRAIFVDGSRGNDQWSGTLTNPLRTISVALRRVPSNGGRVIVRGGDYPGLVTFDRRATPENPITLRSYSGERVRLLGGGYRIPALWIVNASGFRVRGLEITSAQGASVRVENSSDIELVGNDIHHSGFHGVLVTGTGTSSPTGNRNIQLWSNRIHENGGLDGGYNVIGNHGVYYGATASQTDGIDHRSVNGVIANNVFFDQPFGRHLQIGSQVDSLIVTNNTFDNAAQDDPRAGKAIVLYGEDNDFAPRRVLVVNNIIAFSRHEGVHGSSPRSLTGNLVTRNVAFSNGKGDFVPRYGAVVLFELGSNLTGLDPAFIDRDANDYRLTPSSPVSGTALREYAPPRDALGRPRDRRRPDPGAFEQTG